MITALSRFRSFAVIARNSSFVYKGRATRRAAGRAGARRPLRARRQRQAGRRPLRITAQLVDGATGAHLWAEHFDGSARRHLRVPGPHHRRRGDDRRPADPVAEIERSRRERPGSIAAYDAYLQAVPKINKETAKENAEAYALLTRALALEPDNALLFRTPPGRSGTAARWAGRQSRQMTVRPASSSRVGRCNSRGRSDVLGALRPGPSPDRKGIRLGDGHPRESPPRPIPTIRGWLSRPASRICTAAPSTSTHLLSTGQYVLVPDDHERLCRAHRHRPRTHRVGDHAEALDGQGARSRKTRRSTRPSGC